MMPRGSKHTATHLILYLAVGWFIGRLIEMEGQLSSLQLHLLGQIPGWARKSDLHCAKSVIQHTYFPFTYNYTENNYCFLKNIHIY